VFLSLVLSGLFVSAIAAKCPQPRIVKAHRPTTLYVIGISDMSSPERTMIATLQGIIADHSDEQIWIRQDAGGYNTWLQDLVDNHGVTRIDTTDPWFLLDHFASSLDGYILYQNGDGSINSATSLAGQESAVVVETSIESQVIAQGLSLVLDLRGVDETWIHENLRWRMNYVTAIEQKEAFDLQLRDYAVLSRAFTFYDGNSAFRETVLDGLDPDGAIMGWGDATSGEDVFIRAASERGVFTIPADHTHNLSSLSGFPVEEQSQNPASPVTMDPGTHYVSFFFTDGDNLQWALGLLQSDPKWFASAIRGSFDMNWGLPPSLARAAPTVMKWYYDNASSGSGQDFFIAGPSGGGYMYPSLYPEDELAYHTQDLAEWMALGDLNVVEILDFDSLTQVDLWDEYTKHDQIDALLYLEYGDHSQHDGTTVWSNGKPVLSPRIKLWRGLAGSDEASIINRINSAPRDPTSPSGYSIVCVGVWEHSLDEIQAIIDGFSSDTQVVTLGAMVDLMRENVPHDVSFAHEYRGQDFQTGDLSLSGSATWAIDNDGLFAPLPKRMRLTHNGGGLVGSAWHQQQIDPSRSWTSTFRFQITYGAMGGADGLGFIIQGDGLLSNPGHEALGASNPRLAVVIDTWNNGPEGTDESLKVILNGNLIYLNDLLDFGPDPNPGSADSVFRMELTYSAPAQSLSIRFFDEGGTDALYDTVTSLDLSAFGPSFAGFSADTGASTQNHDILTWMLNAASP
jgi:hypothetical protein